ncbi:MAG: hypothetical protein AB2L14_29660 [Candidatus Xenobiia bacterium LiM19]
MKMKWRGALQRLFLTAVILTVVLLCTAQWTWSQELTSSDYDVALCVGKKICAGSSFSVRVIVRNRNDGEVMPGIPVKIALLEGKEEKAQYKGVTDSRGTLSPLLSVPGREGKMNLEITVGEGAKSTVISGQINVLRRELLMLDGVLKQNASERAFIGRIRLMSRPDFAGIGSERLVVEIADSKSNVLSRREVNTDPRGFAAVEFPLPAQRSQAVYELRARGEHASKSRRFVVSGSLSDELLLNLSFEKTTLMPGDAIIGTVQARLPDGRPAGSASIELTIKARDKEDKTLAALERQTDEKGFYRFKSQVPSLFNEKKRSMAAYLIFQAKVTKGRRVGECTRALPILASAPYLNLLPERVPLKRGIPSSLTVISIDGEGAPFPLKARLSGDGLSENIDPAMRGWASFETVLKNREAGHFILSATDSKGNAFQESFQFPVEKSAQSLLIRPDRHFYGKGETLKLDIVSTEKTGTVYLDFTAGDQIIRTDSVDLNGGRATFTVTDRERFAGPLSIKGYLLQGGARIDDELSVLYDPEASFHIKVSSLKNRYTPGEILPLECAISMEKGGESPSQSVVELLLGRENSEKSHSQAGNTLLHAAMEGFPFHQDGRQEALLTLLLSPEGRLDTLKEKLAALLCASVHTDPVDFISTLPPQCCDSAAMASSISVPVGMSTPRLDAAMYTLWRHALSGERGKQFLKDYSGAAPIPCNEVLLEKEIYRALSDSGTEASISAETSPYLMHLSLPPAPPNLERAEEAHYYEPLVLAGKDGIVKRDIPLPPHNFDGELTIRALTGNGELSDKITIFQQLLCEVPLLFTALTEKDRISLPVRLVNYCGEKSDLSVEISRRPWFELKGDRKLKTSIGAYEEGFLFFNLDILGTGRQKMTVAASMGGAMEEVRGDYEVLPRAARDLNIAQGIERTDFTEKISFPQDSLQEGRSLSLVLYCGDLSPIMRALQALSSQRMVTSQALMTKLLLEMEMGSELKKIGNAGKSGYEDAVSADAAALMRDFGSGGGVSLLPGRAPSSKETACAFMALGKIKTLRAVDDESRAKMLKWLLSKRSPKGMWIADEGSASSLSTSAYIVGALLEGGLSAKDLESSVLYLREASKESRDPFILALMLEIEKQSGADPGRVEALASRLISLIQSKGALRFWRASGSSGTSPLPADCEVTSRAVCALGRERLKNEKDGIARYLIGNQEADGTWSPVQSSYPALKALNLMYGGEGSPGEIALNVNGTHTHTFKGGGGGESVCRKVDLSEYLGDENTLKFRLSGGIPLMYQLVEEYYIPARIKRASPFTVSVTRRFDRTKVKRGDKVRCDLTWSSSGLGAAPRIMVVDFPVPWGFRAEREALNALRAEGAIVDYELTKQDLRVFVMSSSSDSVLTLALTALFPCRVAARPVLVYDYDCPQRRGSDFIIDLEVSQ